MNKQTDYITTPEGTTLIYDKSTGRITSKRDRKGNIFILTSNGKYKKIDKL